MHKARGFHSYGVSTWCEVLFLGGQRKLNLPDRREVEQLLCPQPQQCFALASGMASQISPLSHPRVSTQPQGASGISMLHRFC